MRCLGDLFISFVEIRVNSWIDPAERVGSLSAVEYFTKKPILPQNKVRVGFLYPFYHYFKAEIFLFLPFSHEIPRGDGLRRCRLVHEFLQVE